MHVHLNGASVDSRTPGETAERPADGIAFVVGGHDCG